MSKKEVLSKFMILCWAAFMVMVVPMGCRVDTPVGILCHGTANHADSRGLETGSISSSGCMPMSP